MEPGTTIFLTQRLDRLEVRGRGYLKRLAHRRGTAAALAVGAPVALAAAAALCVGHLIRPVAPVLVLASAVAIPGVAAAIAFMLARRGARTRDQALAVIDRRLALKDRATASDEFLRAPVRDGFRDAALQEAQSWIDGAANAPLPPAGSAVRPTRTQWATLAGAVLFVLVAVLLGRGHGGPGPIADAGRSMQGAAEDAAAGGRQGGRGIDDPAASAMAGDDAATSGSSANGGTSPSRQQPQAGQGQPMTGAGDRDRAGAQAGAAAVRSSAAEGGASAGASTPGKRDAGTRSEAGAGSRSADPSSASPGATSPRDAAGGEATGEQKGERGRRAMPGTQKGEAAGLPPQPGKAPGNRSGAAAPDIAVAKSAAQQPAQQKAGQQGANGAQGAPGSGRSSSKDALKHTRGIGALLLAVPMEDRLIGTVNPGSVRSMTRAAAKAATPDAAAVAAQGRGQQNGDSGRIGHRPASRHDERLVRDYFRRGGAGR